MGTLVGVVYDAQTLAVRRIIVPGNDKEVLDNRHVGPGEAIATAPKSQGYTVNRAIEIVRGKTGRQPPTMQEVHAMDKLNRDLHASLAPVR